MKIVDCSFGEGGGQILRTALSLGALFKEEVVLKKIRENRPKKGLMPQHLAAIKLLQKITNAEIKGAKLFSRELHFKPGKLQGGEYNVNIGTAGSITLLIQTILLPVIYAEEDFTLRAIGGTDVPFSPPANFLKEVFFPVLNKVGAKLNLEILARGYYPKGLGRILFKSYKAKLPLKRIKILEKGNFEKIKIFSHASGMPKDVVDEQVRGARRFLEREGFSEIEEEKEYYSGESFGSGTEVIAYFENVRFGGSSLYRKGVPAFNIGQEAAQRLIAEIKRNAACDFHLADQLIPFMALAKGKSEIVTTKLTNHCITNIRICEMLLGVEFELSSEKIGSESRIAVEGISFCPL